jgi:cobalt-zinc-cadmium efflux system protein
VIGDLLGSVGALTAGVVILTTGWTPVDPLASVADRAPDPPTAPGSLVTGGGGRAARGGARGTSTWRRSCDDLAGIDGLEEVHDVHVWTLTSGFVALSAHGVIDDVSAT